MALIEFQANQTRRSIDVARDVKSELSYFGITCTTKTTASTVTVTVKNADQATRAKIKVVFDLFESNIHLILVNEWSPEIRLAAHIIVKELGQFKDDNDFDRLVHNHLQSI